MPNSIQAERRGQTRREAERLARSLDEWEHLRRGRDTRAQYVSQLDAVCAEIKGALAILIGQLSGISSQSSIGAVYATCARSDRQLAWLWRMFDFFREKFDQRDNPEFTEAVFAADEVVWSCYRPFFQRPSLAKRRMPAPLPYIADEYSPAAIRQDQTPDYLIESGSEFEVFRDYFKQLPVPILKLPQSTLTTPWSLILIGHEVGHFIQPLVQPAFGFVAEFRRRIEEAVRADGGSTADGERWGAWAPEIFADWYSVLTLGQWAVWMMAQLELSEPDTMLEPRGDYPSPLARLALMATLADRHSGGAGASILSALGLNWPQERPQGDLRYISAVVKAVVAPLPDGLGKLEDVLLFRPADYAPKDEVERWSEALVLNQTPAVKNDLSTPRLVAAGCGQACWRLMRVDDETQRNQQLQALARTPAVIRECAPEGKRAAPATAAPKAEAGRALADLLSSLADHPRQSGSRVN